MRLAALATLALLVSAMLVSAPGCSPAPDGPQAGAGAPDREAGDRSGRLRVRAASRPLGWLVEQVGGDVVSFEIVLPPGADAAEWTPTESILEDLRRADLVVVNGAGLEGWLERARIPDERLVDTTRDVVVITENGRPNPSTWMDPRTFRRQASAVHAALVAARPSKRAELDANLERVHAGLDQLAQSYRATFAEADGLALAASGDHLAYLARRHGLDVRAFDFSPDASPSDEQVQSFDEWRAGRPIALVIWPERPEPVALDAFEEGAVHAVIDPLTETDERGGYEYLRRARENASAFGEILSELAALERLPG